eukprot:gnl/TRDRNA2_/TRDRNA2_173859_c1_seq3.p1 gnl/TRDRNA2_/TRDRNA2_173859_c1~~gnl/TRDRNA2_/TRDRNA2_173859_c1_seq3.p1  ORF type:complete len:774 (+),score=97.64 gnl/TRDRNA2_/TRDRNA2_173859_c1_seq3:3-2324(+)
MQLSTRKQSTRSIGSSDEESIMRRSKHMNIYETLEVKPTVKQAEELPFAGRPAILDVTDNIEDEENEADGLNSTSGQLCIYRSSGESAHHKTGKNICEAPMMQLSTKMPSIDFSDEESTAVRKWGSRDAALASGCHNTEDLQLHEMRCDPSEVDVRMTERGEEHCTPCKTGKSIVEQPTMNLCKGGRAGRPYSYDPSQEEQAIHRKKWMQDMGSISENEVQISPQDEPRHSRLRSAATSTDHEDHTACRFVRADCRFTRRGSHSSSFAGVGRALPHRKISAWDTISCLPVLKSEEGSRVRIALEHADNVDFSADAVTLLSGIVEELSTLFVVHARCMREDGGVTRINDIPTPLALLRSLVEVLDYLVPHGGLPDLSHSNGSTPHFSSEGETAKALSKVAGAQGILQTCLEIMKTSPQNGFLEELSLHAAFAVRLLLCWQPSELMPPPGCTLLATSGRSSLLQAVNSLVADASRNGETGCWVQLAMLFDSLHIVLECPHSRNLLESGNDVRQTRRRQRRSLWIAGRSLSSSLSSSLGGGGGGDTDVLADLSRCALRALESLVTTCSYDDTDDAAVACDTAAATAVQLIATTVKLPTSAHLTSSTIASVVSKILAQRPLSLHMAAAVRALCCAQHPTHGWMAFDKRRGSDNELRKALAAASVAKLCAEGAKCAIDLLEPCLTIDLQDDDDMSPASLTKECDFAASKKTFVCKLWGHVDAITQALHSKSCAEMTSAEGTESDGTGSRSLRNSLSSTLRKLKQAVRSRLREPAVSFG